MLKNKKLLALIAGLLVLFIGVAITYAQSENLQGFLKMKFRPTTGKLYMHKNKLVTLVVSPVTSTVPSKVASSVTSKGGTSEVASLVSSFVTTPVASAVAAPKKMTTGVNVKTVQKLTNQILTQVAKADYKANPSKYKLSSLDRAKLFQIYQNQMSTNKIQMKR